MTAPSPSSPMSVTHGSWEARPPHSDWRLIAPEHLDDYRAKDWEVRERQSPATPEAPGDVEPKKISPGGTSSLPSGESDLAVTPDYTGADTGDVAKIVRELRDIASYKIVARNPAQSAREAADTIERLSAATEAAQTDARLMRENWAEADDRAAAAEARLAEAVTLIDGFVNDDPSYVGAAAKTFLARVGQQQDSGAD
jgi:hypothetical protein